MKYVKSKRDIKNEINVHIAAKFMLKERAAGYGYVPPVKWNLLVEHFFQ